MLFSLRAHPRENNSRPPQMGFAPRRTIKYLSPMATSLLLILCTLPERASALRLAEHLVEQGLAACVNITAPITSVYRWQGRQESAEEVLLLKQ